MISVILEYVDRGAEAEVITANKGRSPADGECGFCRKHELLIAVFMLGRRVQHAATVIRFEMKRYSNKSFQFV